MIFSPSPGENVDDDVRMTNNSNEIICWKAKSSNAMLIGVEPVRGKISAGQTASAKVVRKSSCDGEKLKVQIVYWNSNMTEKDSKKVIFGISSKQIQNKFSVSVTILEIKAKETTNAVVAFNFNKVTCDSTQPLSLFEGVNKISHTATILNITHGIRQRLELVLQSLDGAEIGKVKLDLGLVNQNGEILKGEVSLGSMLCKLEMKATNNKGNSTSKIRQTPSTKIIDYSNVKSQQKIPRTDVRDELMDKYHYQNHKQTPIAEPPSLLCDIPVNVVQDNSIKITNKRQKLKGTNINNSISNAVDITETQAVKLTQVINLSESLGSSQEVRLSSKSQKKQELKEKKFNEKKDPLNGTKNISKKSSKGADSTRRRANKNLTASSDLFSAKPLDEGCSNGQTNLTETFIEREFSNSTRDDTFEQIESEWILSDNTPEIKVNERTKVIQSLPVPVPTLTNELLKENDACNTTNSLENNETSVDKPKQKNSSKHESEALLSHPVNPILGGNVNLKVYIRIRSAGPSQWKVAGNTMGISHMSDRNQYQVDRVIQTSDNVAAYQMTNLDSLAKQFIQGYNCTALAYGQTSSGKTFSMFGERNDGFIPQAVSSILSVISDTNKIHKKYQLRVSYYEIYNEDVFDLLSSCTSSIPIREVSTGMFTPIGLITKDVQTLSDCLDIISKGNAIRSTGFSNLNERSSRSHTVFELTLHKVSKNSKLVSSFNLVDLAGSESLVSEGGNIQQRKETMRINSSLSFLKKVILSLATNEAHVPYRNSSLTKVLKQSLGGNSLTTLICTVNTHEQYKKETRSTLEFGAIAKKVKNTISSNEVAVQVHAGRESKLKKQVETLADELKLMKEEMQRVIEENNALKGQTSAENKLLERLETMQRELVADCQQPAGNSLSDHLHSLFSKNTKTESLFKDVISYMEFGCVVQRRGEKVMLYLSEGEIRSCLMPNGSPDRRLKIDALPLQNIDSIQITTDGWSLRFIKRDSEVLIYGFSSSADREACLLAISLVHNNSNKDFIKYTSLMPLDLCEASQLLPSEQSFCRKFHVLAETYLDAKNQLISSSDSEFLSLQDIRTQTSIDMFTALALVQFFCSEKIVSRHEVYYINQAKDFNS